MRVLLVGSGGREHALAWALAASPLLTRLWIAPGNPGTAELGENVPIDALDIPRLVDFARDQKIDLVLPGPEAPLVAGLADALAAAGLRCCGPSAAAARLEGSKSFTKELCDAAGIATARWEAFDEPAGAREFVRRRGAPIVVKADGLAGGKGVVVAASEAEAEAAISLFMERGALGDAGRTVVLEECLAGEELSVFALCDGQDAVFLGAAQDHKRAGEGDTGPNTGGMGAVSPPGGHPPALGPAIMDAMIRPALAELARRGTPFRGFLYAGVMLDPAGPRLIEFNARFGDPECQVLMPRLQSDLLPALLAACDGELGDFDLRLRPEAAVGVVLASTGYPGAVSRGAPVHGVDRAAILPDVLVFHGGTAREAGGLVAAGGRVLTVVGRGASIAAARERAFAGVRAIDFPGGFYRSDIAARALAADTAQAS